MKGYLSLLVGLCILGLVACGQPTESATNQMNSFQFDQLPSSDISEKMKVYLWEEGERVLPFISHEETPELTEKHDQLLELVMNEEELHQSGYDNRFIIQENVFGAEYEGWQEIELIVMDDHVFSTSPFFQLNEVQYKRTVAINSLRSRTNSYKNQIQLNRSMNLKDVDILGL
ncbi:hypothetical protein AB685_27795 [Bacillus sp. LL01]|uniref:hypothetical protein n=1 Tax=Bacillus sp. LL01 TaxID=1665556 RepID=UPI00064D3407|nr:hypothetical protein [Bacillus sp. LL01]KMJ55329.1 hypothetical protein AB685_27795 [Bacillus sp. LL01]